MQRPGKLCLTPGRRESRQRYDRRRSGKDYRAWYKTAEWRRLRAAQFARQPLCSMCLVDGRTTVATTCDHKRPHKGDRALFFDPHNLDSLCKTHHDSAKQKLEKSGYLPGCDASGFPSDPDHPWRK